MLPIADAGLLHFFSPGEEIADCLMPTAAPGHTLGQVTFTFRHAGERCIFAADVLHSPMQVHFPKINSRWCEWPDAARRTRLALVEEAARTGATVYPAHALGVEGWQIVRQSDAFAVRIGDAPTTASPAPAAAGVPPQINARLPAHV